MVASAELRHSGDYICRAINPAGEDTKRHNVNIRGKSFVFLVSNTFFKVEFILVFFNKMRFRFLKLNLLKVF